MNAVLWLMLLVTPLEQPGEGVTGIFLSIECRKHIPKKREMLSTKSICLTQTPIISPKEFESVGNVMDFGSDVFFDLRFSPRGYETLLKLTENLPDSRLALVVEDQVFFVFKAAELRLAPTFRFQTVMKHKGQMQSVHRQLLSAMQATARE